MSPTEHPVSIVLATLNGAPFLGDQLISLLQQDHTAWTIILSDDGSCDNTLDIARTSITQRRLQVVEGPQKGVAQNFWNGLKHAPPRTFVAFCDQDDVWEPDKLSRALSQLNTTNEPALYSSGRVVVEQNLTPKVTQPRRPVTSFMSLLFRNPVAGHTCVLNPEAVQILQRFPPPQNVPFHDWWAALVLKGVGAQFIHDPVPTLKYRQHDTNVIGAHSGRKKLMLNGTYLGWVRANLDGLVQVQDQLSPQARRVLRVCLPTRAALRLAQRQTRMAHVRDHQQ